MKPLKLQQVTHHLQTLNRLLNQLSGTREFVVIATVLIGIIVQWLLFIGDGVIISILSQAFDHYNAEYFTKYTLSFFRSLLFAVLIISAIRITCSYRLVGLLLIVNASMLLDLGSLVSLDFYHIVKGVRYTDEVNFRDLYTTYEIFCLSYIFIRSIVAAIESRIPRSTHGSSFGEIHQSISPRKTGT
jgi:hypothetical protein